MYVLSSDRAELHYFPSPEDIDGGYAILSHVWDPEGEQTFEEVQTIAKRCKEDGTNPRDFVSHKIRQSCILAEKHGYKWIWNDTCCIDKRSSSELSEAINSMFRYYSLSKVCYAYLRDVPSDDIRDDYNSVFQRSRWHSRGWTLQELIAPEFLIFVSMDWQPFSARTELADTLEKITKVPARLLKGQTKVSDYSVAQRMSWAAWRDTTREEDRAYSMMGLFGIHMPTLYGEGKKAFRRLQEEIMKQSVDPSLFLWDEITALDSEVVETTSACAHDRYYQSMLATIPHLFRDCSDITFLPCPSVDVAETRIEKPDSAENQAATSGSAATLDSMDLPAFTITPFGVQAHLPVVRQGPKGVLLAILPCFRKREGEHLQRLGLLLSPCIPTSNGSRALYHVLSGSVLWRVIAFDDVQLGSVHNNPDAVAVEWKEVYITSLSPNVHEMVSRFPTPLINTMLSPPFRAPGTFISALRGYGSYVMNPESSTLVPWTGTPHIAAIFRRGHTDEFMAILLGRCESHIEDRGDQDRGRLGSHWAAVRFYTVSEDQTSELKLKAYEHVCPDDHVGLDSTIWVEDPHLSTYSWEPPGTTQHWVFSFTCCRISPDTTLVVNVHHRIIRTTATLHALGIRPFRPRIPPGITPLTHLKSIYARAEDSSEGSISGSEFSDNFLHSDID